MSDKPIEEMTFEQAMAELEAVVDQLDRGDVALDESIKLYERGALLKNGASENSKRLKKKLRQLLWMKMETQMARSKWTDYRIWTRN